MWAMDTQTFNANQLPERLQQCGLKQLFISGVMPTTVPVAIVGTRRPTPYGRRVTEELAGKLGAVGIPVVSGLAFGIDQIAHTAALDAGGRCIAVLPSGLDRATISPQSHLALADRIRQQDGAVVSEYPDGAVAYKGNYHARNRIIAGFAEHVVVIEAGIPSGTLITAGHAARYSRDVWALPGPITSSVSAGTNRLIRDGAKPLVSVEAFLDELGVSSTPQSGHPLLRWLLDGPSTIDYLASRSDQSPAVIERELITLELRGLIKRTADGQVLRT